MIYLLRHAHAGNKRTWSGPDGRRPLSAAGRREAAGLVRVLDGRPITTILSSPALRCEQTVQPLAEHRSLPVGRHAQWPKGSTWLLRLTGDRVAEATYLPPWGGPRSP